MNVLLRVHPLRVHEGDLVARNDQDKPGRSLEEQLASLDAMSGGESAEPSEGDSAKEAEETEAPADAWTNTPPAPAFPPHPGAPSQDPPAPPSPEGQQSYGYGFPGYPPQDFGGVHQPPRFPGMPGQEYGGYPPYQPPEQPGPPPYDAGPPAQEPGPAPHEASPYDAEPANGSGRPYDVPSTNGSTGEAPDAEPEGQYEGDAERTQFVEQQHPAAEATQMDTGYEGYAEGGYPSYAPCPPPQFGPPGADQGRPYPGQQFYGRPPGPEQEPPPYQGAQHAPQQEPEQAPYQQQPYGRQPYAQPAQHPYDQQPYAQPSVPEQGGQPYPGQGYAQQPGVDQGPPLPSLPEAYSQQSDNGVQTADSLSADMLLRGRRHAPSGGWRRAVYKASGGVIHPGESPHELRRRELLARSRTPVAGGHHRVAVMSLKGGVGKTTTTVGLGATLASMRGDRVIAVDANPDRGTLSDKVRLETATTVRDLLNEHQQIQRYADVRAYTSQAPSRLEVLASDRDPAVSEAFSEEDYRTVAHVLEHFYSICLTDCGTGLLHSAMAGVLGLANQLVLVSSPSVDGARSASATLDWLEAHHYGDLVRGGVVVLSMVRSRSRSTVDLDRLQAHFESRCRAVVRVPYDPHLEEGAEVELDQLSQATQDAYLVLAATVGDGFAWPR
jgi:MinD-like ATPase involved in chromosome partitioning or flagellar assembly